ncbi:hypothetical protein UFOVP1640_3 [uncultured Caudovirales phage]|jgi:hypothetical protein|uniref:Uncharacterized protein n=1 Tax=uncultured Caudovirales phage TaxID=2100421 RepID=A0A6J5RSA1_9CAUD|nr:hypothetical protein UFOVP1286_6 [uncultured Caudovirales phage]CAB4205544.1 hypothetical protein UFOVP1407_36 [uncultured Caudovirales phage]CAB4221602.1 hypothetical protein UFOVP1640_3 [uncultured Caudovirales phage]
MTAAYVQTYDNLVADVINYMERDDAQFVAQIPTLIGLAESAIAAELKTLLQLIVVETNLLAAQDILEKPTRWRKTISMKVNGKPILMRSQDYVAQYQSESDPGQPKYYAEYDYNNWAIAPVPDASYPVEIIYYSLVQPLDTTNQTNLFTQQCPQAMLFGTLLQAQGYLKAIDKLPIWKTYYTDSLAALKKEDNSRRVDRNTSIQEP